MNNNNNYFILSCIYIQSFVNEASSPFTCTSNNNNKYGLYNYNENIHVDDNKIITLEIMREKKGITINNKDGKDEFSVSF